jgi:hypothetical protein
LIQSPFFDQLTFDEKLYGNFMKDNEVAHTAKKNCISGLNEVFREQQIPPHINKE